MPCVIVLCGLPTTAWALGSTGFLYPLFLVHCRNNGSKLALVGQWERALIMGGLCLGEGEFLAIGKLGQNCGEGGFGVWVQWVQCLLPCGIVGAPKHRKMVMSVPQETWNLVILGATNNGTFSQQSTMGNEGTWVFRHDSSCQIWNRNNDFCLVRWVGMKDCIPMWLNSPHQSLESYHWLETVHNVVTRACKRLRIQQ